MIQIRLTITGQIQVIHNNEVQKLTVNYQLPNIFVNGSAKLALEDINDNRVGNGLDINLQIPVELGHTYTSWDLFGTIPVTIPDFSFDIQGPKGQNIADWIKLNSETGKITDQNGERGTFHVSLAPQVNNVIMVNITDVTPLAVTSWNIGNHLMTTLPLNVHLPKSAFATADSEVPITVSSINIPFQTGNTSFHSIDSAITFNVVQPKDVFDEQIRYEEHKTYQNINAGRYMTDTGGYKPDDQSIMIWENREPGYNVSAFTNIGNKDLQNIRYVLDIPDGLSIYSVTYGGGKLKNVPDSLILTLSDGRRISLTKDQLQGKPWISLKHNTSHDGYYINSDASIRKVEAFYSTVLGHSAFDVTASKDKNGYRIESKYASGQPLKNADMLYFKARISSEDPANEIKSPDLTLCEVYIKDFQQGVDQEVIGHQLTGKAGNEKAGSMAYQIADSSAQALRPNLEHPIAD